MKLSFVQILKVQVKRHILSRRAGLNSKSLHFYERNKVSKNNKIKKEIWAQNCFSCKMTKMHLRPSCIHPTSCVASTGASVPLLKEKFVRNIGKGKKQENMKPSGRKGKIGNVKIKNKLIISNSRWNSRSNPIFM